jgi:hypothetical protein
MGKWIKLKDSSNNTVALKYTPGMDRFIDHGVDRGSWAAPLLATASAWTPYQPSENSLKQYGVELMKPSNANLRTADNNRRFLNLTSNIPTEPQILNFTLNSFNNAVIPTISGVSIPVFNWVDVYTLIDLHAGYITTGGDLIDINDPYGPTTPIVYYYGVVAVIQPPDQTYSLATNNSSVRRWRRPNTTAIQFNAYNENNSYSMLDNAYSQLYSIFGPF